MGNGHMLQGIKCWGAGAGTFLQGAGAIATKKNYREPEPLNII